MNESNSNLRSLLITAAVIACIPVLTAAVWAVISLFDPQVPLKDTTTGGDPYVAPVVPASETSGLSPTPGGLVDATATPHVVEVPVVQTVLVEIPVVETVEVPRVETVVVERVATVEVAVPQTVEVPVVQTVEIPVIQTVEVSVPETVIIEQTREVFITVEVTPVITPTLTVDSVVELSHSAECTFPGGPGIESVIDSKCPRASTQMDIWRQAALSYIDSSSYLNKTATAAADARRIRATELAVTSTPSPSVESMVTPVPAS